MKKKYMRELITLFDCLPEAGKILSGMYDENSEEKAIVSSKVSSAYFINNKINYDPDNKFLRKVFDEIDGNLYKYYSIKELYIKDILREFVSIALFLDLRADIEWIDNKDLVCRVGNKKLPPIYGATLKLLINIEEILTEKKCELSDVEEYVLSCSTLLYFFSHSLDARCLHFGIDLLAIQKELEINICRERNMKLLLRSGYADKVIGILNNENIGQKALPDSFSKSFTELLTHDKPDALAELCKNIFNSKQSPKDYAIMLALLSLYGYVHLADKQRKGFYESWYAFIEKPLPETRNYFSINKHIDIVKGFQFTNDTDPDYLNLKRKFDIALKELA